ncbi:MAG: hypothetical protein RIR48_1081 [Bacteroidota bacterium]|jgi:hypothetical protein
MKVKNWTKYAEFKTIAINEWNENLESEGWEIINFFVDTRYYGDSGNRMLIGLCKINVNQHANWLK